LITVRRGVRDFVAFTRLARHSTVVESRVSWPRHPAGDSRRGHAESPWWRSIADRLLRVRAVHGLLVSVGIKRDTGEATRRGGAQQTGVEPVMQHVPTALVDGVENIQLRTIHLEADGNSGDLARQFGVTELDTRQRIVLARPSKQRQHIARRMADNTRCIEMGFVLQHGEARLFAQAHPAHVEPGIDRGPVMLQPMRNIGWLDVSSPSGTADGWIRRPSLPVAYQIVWGGWSVIHCMGKVGARKRSLQWKGPLVGIACDSRGKSGRCATMGTDLPCGRITGQPSCQVTGSRKVSRPRLYWLPRYGSVPRNTAHQDPSFNSTNCACPVDVTGCGRPGARSRWVRIGLPSHGT